MGDLNSFTGDYEEAVYWTKKANNLRNYNYDFELTAYINQKLAKDYKALNQLDSAYKYLNESFQPQIFSTYCLIEFLLIRYVISKSDVSALIKLAKF